MILSSNNIFVHPKPVKFKFNLNTLTIKPPTHVIINHVHAVQLNYYLSRLCIVFYFYVRASFLPLTFSVAHLRRPDTINMRVGTSTKKGEGNSHYNAADRSSLNSHLNYKKISSAIASSNAEWPDFSPLATIFQCSVYFPAS